MYRLTKGTVSVLRKTVQGVKEAQASGFVLDGECDESGSIVSASIVLEPEAPIEPETPRSRRRKASEEGEE